MSEPRDIDHMAESATSDFLRRSSITYLECCISLMLTTMSVKDVAAVLEREAKDMMELG